MSLKQNNPNEVTLKQLRVDQGETLLVVIGRSNYKKKSASVDSLIHELYKFGMSVCWYESQAGQTARFLDTIFQKIVPPYIASLCTHQPLLGKLIKVTLLLGYPSKWSYFFSRFQERHHTSASELTKFIRSLDGRPVTLITHSAGGIVGSLIEDEPAVQRHVCFGYPFKHPNKPEEQRRFKHLETITKPFLIIQGNRDVYGTALDSCRYKLSSSIKLKSISATHDYEEISGAEFNDLVLAVKSFIDLGAERV